MFEPNECPKCKWKRLNKFYFLYTCTNCGFEWEVFPFGFVVEHGHPTMKARTS